MPLYNSSDEPTLVPREVFESLLREVARQEVEGIRIPRAPFRLSRIVCGTEGTVIEGEWSFVFEELDFSCAPKPVVEVGP